MKIPTSSSFILATLAISSSSSSLAAPTSDGSTEHGMSRSPSNGNLMDERANIMMERSSANLDLQERDLLGLGGIVSSLPVVGPVLAPIIKKVCLDPDAHHSRSVDEKDVSQDELAKLQSAVDTVSGALSGILPIGLPSLPVGIPSLPVGGIVSNLPAPLQSAISGLVGAKAEGSTDGSSKSSSNSTSVASHSASATAEGLLLSPTTTIASAEAVDPTATGASSSASASATGGPSSPGVPAGPPNTPALPIALPIGHLPI